VGEKSLSSKTTHDNVEKRSRGREILAREEKSLRIEDRAVNDAHVGRRPPYVSAASKSPQGEHRLDTAGTCRACSEVQTNHHTCWAAKHARALRDQC